MKSTQKQRPVSTLGFSEAKSSSAEVAVETIASSVSSVALVDDEVKDRTDILLRQVSAALCFCFYVCHLR